MVEIIKREYLKTLDPALAEAGSLSGLHQYNEIGDLEEAGHVERMGDEEQERIEALALALQGRNQYVSMIFSPPACTEESPQCEAEEDCVHASDPLPEGNPRAYRKRRDVRFLTLSSASRVLILETDTRSLPCGS